LGAEGKGGRGRVKEGEEETDPGELFMMYDGDN